MKPEDELPPSTPPDAPTAPFEFGDSTVLALRAQSFSVDNEYGTMILSGNAAPVPLETTEMPLPKIDTPPPPMQTTPVQQTDPVLRLEEKIDTALRLIQSLQRQLDSIDAALARTLNRS